MSEKGMQILHSRKLLPNMKQVSSELYENYVYGKPKRVRFLRVGKQKKSEKLELVHTDVWGPAQVQSLGASCYYVTFIDDVTVGYMLYSLLVRMEGRCACQRCSSAIPKAPSNP